MLCTSSGRKFRSALQIALFILPAIFVSQISASLSAQVTLQGSKSFVNFGSIAVSYTSATQALQFEIKGATSVSRIAVLTNGSPNNDFTDAGNSTCQAQSYSSTTNCLVNVVFKPRVPGWRRGAVVFYNSAGSALATVPVFGLGSGPQLAFLPVSSTTLLTGIQSEFGPSGVVTDPFGNTFVADYFQNQVTRIAPDGTQTVIITNVGFSGGGNGSPNSLAIDGAGNLYIAGYNDQLLDTTPGIVTKYAPNGTGYTPAGVVGNTYNAQFVAVDRSNNVYIFDTGVLRSDYDSPVGGAKILKVTPDGTQTVLLKFSPGFPFPPSTVDGAGNIYSLDYDNAQIYKYAADANGIYSQPTVIPTQGLSYPYGVAIDGGGNIYTVARNTGNHYVLAEIAPSGKQTVLLQDTSTVVLGSVEGIGQGGNVFITTGSDSSFYHQALQKVIRSASAAVNFPTPTKGSSTDNTDGPRTVTVQNLGNTNLKILSLTYPADFPKGPGDASTCQTGDILLDTTCTIPIDFAPISVSGSKTSIALSESISVRTNSLNKTPSSASPVVATGTETKLASRLVLNSSSATSVSGAPVTFTATATGSSDIPNGTVQFFSNSVSLGTAALSAGKAVFRSYQLPVGTDSITATYSGSELYAGVTSAAIKQTVTNK